MSRLSSVQEFVEYRQQTLRQKANRPELPTLVICAGTGGQASGSNDIMRVIKRHILEQNLSDKIRLRVTGCQGFCEMDPFIVVEPGQHLYPRLKMEDVSRVIKSALAGHVDEDLIYREPRETAKYHCQSEIPFFKKQVRTVLGLNQKLDPIRITNYFEQDGYAALEKVLLKNDPEWIIQEVKASGLRGRGGAGFPTGKKWGLARAAGNGQGMKYVVCNCDEGDPGAYMDRSLLEGNPHMILEGLLIAGLAVGAPRGIIYVRSEYPLAIKHTTIALQQARELGLLGEDILGTGHDFDIEVVRGAGAFVCGEETALIRSIQGLTGEPKQRPPYPVEKGIDGYPTCINNVETLANIPIIIKEGAKRYAQVGVPGNTGTKIFSLVGKVRNTGLVEVPMGIPIGEIVYDIGGGSSSKAKIKAVQTGGPSGGCIPAAKFDLPIDFESLTKVGSIMGSGGMIVMDDQTCMVDVAKYYMNFLKDESCGKCFTCRKGTQRMHEILDDISRGKGTPGHLDLLQELAEVVRDTTMCGLGQTASNPVLSTLKYFKGEYLAHIQKKRCPAVVCKEIISSPCQHACPIDTEAPVYIGLIAQGRLKEAHEMIRKDNPLPSICGRVCHHPCESRCTAGEGGEPIAIRELKRYVTDWARGQKIQPKPPDWTLRKKKVAIIGSGPAGLSAGYFLARNGYGVTIFEALPVAGGMLAVGIPEHRLPREVLNYDIDLILQTGVEIKTNHHLGKDFTLQKLKDQGFSAVFLATGAHRSLTLGIPGENAPEVLDSLDLLRATALKKKIRVGKRVGVVGGGNAAVDAARTALRLGAQEVTIIYRRTRAEMPAYAEEIEDALEEGIPIQYLTAPTRVVVEQGKVVGLECQKMKLGELDLSGRRRPVPVTRSEFVIPLDTIIPAIGQVPENSFLKKERDLEFTADGPLMIDSESLMTSRKGIFAGGDLVTGPNTAIQAIAYGKHAAEVIARYLEGAKPEREYHVSRTSLHVDSPELTPEESASGTRRTKASKAPTRERIKDFREVDMGFSTEEARREARRCLRCDLEVERLTKEREPKPESKIGTEVMAKATI